MEEGETHEERIDADSLPVSQAIARAWIVSLSILSGVVFSILVWAILRANVDHDLLIELVAFRKNTESELTQSARTIRVMDERQRETEITLERIRAVCGSRCQ